MSLTTPRRFTSMRSILVVCLVAVCMAAVPAAASAAGFHMSRDFSANGDSARAYGKTCGKSKFGDWQWRVSVGSGDLRVNYRWIEPVRADGKARNLGFTEISGPTVESQPESLQDDFVAAVKRVLNKITVRSVARPGMAGRASRVSQRATARARQTSPGRAASRRPSGRPRACPPSPRRGGRGCGARAPRAFVLASRR